MGAKIYLVLASAAFCFGGCSTIKRLAPPGFIKYEDLSKGIAPNEAIDARVDAAVSGGGKYPKLSEVNMDIPEKEGTAAVDLQRHELVVARDRVNDKAAQDQARATAEFGQAMEQLSRQRDTIEKEVARARAAAVRDQKQDIAPRP